MSTLDGAQPSKSSLSDDQILEILGKPDPKALENSPILDTTLQPVQPTTVEVRQAIFDSAGQDSALDRATDLVADTVHDAAVYMAGILGRDLATKFLNPLELKIGQTVHIDHPLGGNVTLGSIARSNDGVDEISDYLFQREVGSAPEWIVVRVRPTEEGQEESATLLGVVHSAAYSADIDFRDGQPTFTWDDKTYDRLGSEHKRTISKIADTDGDGVAELSEMTRGEVSSQAFYRKDSAIKPGGKEFLYVETGDTSVRILRGSRIPQSKITLIEN